MLKVSAQLDLVFGKNGFVYNNLGIGSTEIQHIAIDKENKIVTAVAAFIHTKENFLFVYSNCACMSSVIKT